MLERALNMGFSMLKPATVVKKQQLPLTAQEWEEVHALREKLREEYDSGLDCPDTLDDEPEEQE